MKFLKNSIQSYLNKKGILLHKKTALNSEDKILEYLLGAEGIQLVLDIGANKGQFGMELIEAGFKGRVISFEPLPDVYEQLKKVAQSHPGWETENLALGSESGEITINVSENTESSSVLAMLDKHADLAPESKYVKSIQVPLTTLDRYFEEKIPSADNVYLKIDVQGYEEAVLLGATQFLKRVKILQLELSFIPLYEKSPLYYKLMERLEELGFSFYSFFPAFSDYKTGQIFQVDALYIKR